MRTIPLSCLLIILFSAAACRKSTTPAPEISTVIPAAPSAAVTPVTEGSLSGRIIPSLAASTVELSGNGISRTVTVEAATGNFRASLPAGNYELRVPAAAGFTAPATRQLALSTGQTTAAGDIALFPAGTSRAFYLLVSGVARKGTLTSTFAAGKLELSNVETISTNTGTPEQKTEQYSFNLEIPSLNGPGSYSEAKVSYVRAVPSTGGFPISGRPWLTWSSAGSTAKVTITDSDTAARTVSGYFSGPMPSTIAGQSDLNLQVLFRLNY